LRGGGRAKIGLSIVKAVAIDVIHEHIVWYFKYLAVHVELAFCAVSGLYGTYSVVATAGPAGGIPFMLGQAPVIVGIDDCILALGQRDSAEGVPVANPSIQKHRPVQ